MLNARKGVQAWPFFRGVFSLFEALQWGSQALRFSAEQYESDPKAKEEAVRKSATINNLFSVLSTFISCVFAVVRGGLVGVATSDLEPPLNSGKRDDGSGGFQAVSLLAWVFALVLFVALPQAFAAGVGHLLAIDVDIRSPAFQALTGSFKLIIVIGYMLILRRIEAIRRMFMYHGAEHKAIATYEADEQLSVVCARSKSRLHPRCGTTFLVMVVFVSMLVFTGIGPWLPQLQLGGVAEQVLFFLMKLPFLPVIASITYEIQRFTARFCLRGFLRFTLYPGFVVQRITTIEPDDAQLEVALASLRSTLWREQAQDGQVQDDQAVQAGVAEYRDFDHLMQQSAFGARAESA